METNGWYAILAAAIGWLIAQTWKTIAGVLAGRTKQMNLATFIGYATRSGGMPSGHSAFMTALTVYIGMAWGFDSGLFALAVANTIIVIYDATHVRYAVGVQGKALNGLLEKDGKKPLPLVEGHTLPQVTVGILIGVITGVITALLV